jgi:hypothetical protein
MHEHTDKPCKHDLKECTECGNVYCSKCSQEWLKEKNGIYTIPASWPYSVTGITFTTADSVNTPHTHQ